MPLCRKLAATLAFALGCCSLKAQQVALSSPGSWTRDGFRAGAFQTEVSPARATQLTHSLQIGSTAIDVTLSDEIEYSDNVRVEQNGREGLSNTFNLGLESMWSPTKIQEIALTGSIGSRVPVYGPGKGRTLWNIAPTTALKMNVYVDQLRLSPFFRASRSLDPVSALVVSETETFTQTMEDAGIVADYPLHQANVQLVALAGNKRSAADSAPAMNTRRYSTALRAIKSFVPGSSVGTDVAVFTQTYNNGPSISSSGQGASAFVRWPLTKLITGQLSAGWDSQGFTDSKDETDSRRSSEPFFMLSINHRPNANLSYSVLLRRAVFDGVSTNYLRSTEFTLSPIYSLGESLTTNASFTFKTADESTAAGDHGHNVMATVGGSYASKRGTNITVSYTYTDKVSSIKRREYTQNRLSFSISRRL